ncbi:cytochrome c [Falsiruegeria mediterranea]
MQTTGGAHQPLRTKTREPEGKDSAVGHGTGNNGAGSYLFYFCSIIWNHVSSRVTPTQRTLTALIMMSLLGLGSANAEDIIAVEHPQVIERIALMRSSKLAIGTLGAMASGRERFARARAGIARRVLIENTRQTAGKFRRNPDDPASNARPHIWTQWGSFKIQTKQARKAAKGLNTRSLNKLRQTLPPMINACLSCHQSFRKNP